MDAPKSKPAGIRLLDVLFGEKGSEEAPALPIEPKPRLFAIYRIAFSLWSFFTLTCVANYFFTLPYVGGWFAEHGLIYISLGGMVVSLVRFFLFRKPRRIGDSPAKGSN